MHNTCDINEYSSFHYNAFKSMVGACFNQDYRIPLTEEQTKKLCDEIIQSVNDGIVYLDLMVLDGEAKGFVIYQVDTPQSDWCEKESWGCIREMYTTPDIRGKGYGRKLAAYAEARLGNLSVPGIYLTTDDTINFWTKLGYQDTGEICKNNNGNILTKML